MSAEQRPCWNHDVVLALALRPSFLALALKVWALASALVLCF